MKQTARKADLRPRKPLATKAVRRDQPSVIYVHVIPLDDDVPMRRCYQCLEVVPENNATLCYPFCVDCCYASDFGGDTEYPDDWKTHYYCSTCKKNKLCHDIWCDKSGCTPVAHV